ncbi:MAG: hypothetical protein M3N93_10605 [Acidobacteriota bacterium]|nr:hypothetical protein [Acidobacteriota bacterium]
MTRTNHNSEFLQFSRALIDCEATFDHLAPAAPGTRCELPAGYRVFDKLRYPLTRLAGVDGYRLLFARALAIGRVRASGVSQLQLNALQVNPDGSLGGFSNDVLNNNGDRLPPDNNDAAVVLTAELLALLVAFVGDVFTLSLVRDVWPGFPVLETELWRKRNCDQPE